MSFYNSLRQLSLKIEQKNIVFATGNVNEIIDINSHEYQEYFPLVSVSKNNNENFINLIEHLCLQAKGLDYSSIKYFSSNNGIIDFLNKKKVVEEDQENDFKELDSGISSLIDFIDQINNEIILMNEDINERAKKLFIIDCSDVLLNRQSDLAPIKIASLIESFTQFIKQSYSSYQVNKIKLVIITRNIEYVNNLISRNNVEFASHTLLVPDKDERERFFNKYKDRFLCLNNSSKNPDHQDYKEAIMYSDGLSFREFFQYAKIDKNIDDKLQNNLSFKELYKLINFNKQKSEWEKIDIDNMKDINSILSSRVKGQDDAIEVVKRTLIRSFTGMNGVLHSSSNNRKPKGALFFVGPTGTGKTELAKSISEFIFGDETRIIRFDMSEFSQEHSDQRLIGAPPGYVGYDVGGELTNAVKQKPFTILLFDEIEKAHPRILDKFLQILEDGRLTSSQGEIIDFSETFIIFTSNIGAKDIQNLDIKNNKQVQEHFIKSVIEFFKNEIGRPEILNRIGYKNIVPFNFVTDEKIISNIVTSKLNKLSDTLLKDKNIELNFKNDAKSQIVKKIASKFDKKMGGRGLITELETYFVDNLSLFIFENFNKINSNIKDGKISKINIVHSNELEFKFN